MMLGVGSPIFIIIPGESKEPVFHHGKVIESDAEKFVAEFDAMEPLPVDFPVIAFNEEDGRFYQQKAIVKALGRTKPNLVLTLERVGAPVSAERRGSYRVRMMKVSLTGKIGDERRCTITDVSPEGFAAVTKKSLQIRSLVNVHIEYETHVLEGQAFVQSVHPNPDGKYRCGFLIPERDAKMRRTLERIASTFQRIHLRSLAEFRVLDTKAEVNGESILALVDGMGAFRETALKILAKQGIADPQPGEWYGQQSLLDALGVISEKLGVDALYNIGLKIPDKAQFPPDINSLDRALNMLDTAYHMNHRYGEIGHYNLINVGDFGFEMVCENPYPCDFDRGILAALCGRYKPKGSGVTATVIHDDSKPCRKSGASSCTYRIIW
ncbi:MAG: hypothetical protein JXA73_03215 [Acidobacteria bacterium]|nr:hypothetical protein [Acidobacteriota bacterium]